MVRIFIANADGYTGKKIVRHLLDKSCHQMVDMLICGLQDYGNELTAMENLCQEHKGKVKCFDMNVLSNKAWMEELKTVDQVCIIPSKYEDRVEKAQLLIDLCKPAKIRRCVLISMNGIEEAMASGQDTKVGDHVRTFWTIEGLAKQANFPVLTILRCNLYMESILLYRPQIWKDKCLPAPWGDDGKTSWMALDDVAKACCWMLLCMHGDDDDLTKCKKFHNRVFRFTGPESLNGHQMASILSKYCGGTDKIVYKNISRSEAGNLLSSTNIPRMEMLTLLDAYEMIRKQMLDIVTDDFKKLFPDQDCMNFDRWCQMNSHLLSFKEE